MHDSGKFREIYVSIFPTLYRIAYRITGDGTAAEDLCQEAFIKYLQRTKPLPSIDQTRYWLIRVVHNLSLNFEKRKNRERRAVGRLKLQPLQDNPTGESELLKNESTTLVQQALKQIPYKMRTVLILREYADMSYREIAKTIGISESNVKVRIYRAREQLRKLLSEEGSDVS